MKRVFIYTFLLVTLKLIKGKIFIMPRRCTVHVQMKLHALPVRLLVITAVTLKSTVFSTVKSCGSVDVH